MTSRVEVRTQGTHGFVQVDGSDISAGVRAVRMSTEAGRPARVVVELAAPNVVTALEGARVVLPAKVHEALVVLGWTPPSEVAE